MGRPNVNIIVNGNLTSAKSTYATVFAKPNIPLEALIVEENKKYVIKHNFDLNGQTVAVPKGCILEFDGGTLDNGTLKLNDDTLINATGKAFDKRIALENSWHIEWNVLWFGAKSMSISFGDSDWIVPDTSGDLADAVQRMINNGCVNIYIPIGSYYWGKTVKCLDNSLCIHGGFIHDVAWGHSGSDYPSTVNLFTESIKLGRTVDVMLEVGVGDKSINSRTLDFYNLNVVCYQGSSSAIFMGFLSSSRIYNNLIRDCGYFIKDYPKLYNKNRKIESVVGSNGGLRITSKVYNNDIRNVARACFACNLGDVEIYDNYVTGSGYDKLWHEDGTFEWFVNKTFFADMSHWHGMDACFIHNNYIDFFYMVYNMIPGNNLNSSHNVYDINSCVFGSYAAVVDDISDSADVSMNSLVEYLPTKNIHYGMELFINTETHEILTRDEFVKIQMPYEYRSLSGMAYYKDKNGNQYLRYIYDSYEWKRVTEYITARAITSIGDDFIRCNNWEWSNDAIDSSNPLKTSANGVEVTPPDWEFHNYNDVPKYTEYTRSVYSTKYLLSRMGVNKKGIDNAVHPLPCDNDSDYFTTETCYAILKLVPTRLNLVLGNITYIDYIIQGEKLNFFNSVESFVIIGGIPDQFNFKNIVNDAKTAVFISALEGTKVSSLPDKNLYTGRKIVCDKSILWYNGEKWTGFDSPVSTELLVTNPELNREIEEYDPEDPAKDINFAGEGKRLVYSVPLNIPDAGTYVTNIRAFLSGDNDNIASDSYHCVRNYMYNLIPGKTYTIRKDCIENNELVTVDYRITTTGHVRTLYIEGVANTRDVGGWPCVGGGVVRPNKVLRGGTLNSITEAGKNEMKYNLKVKTELEFEDNENPSAIIDGADHTSYAINPSTLLDDIELHTYIRNIFDKIAEKVVYDGVNNKSNIYMYCNNGTAKTSYIVVLLLGLLGVSKSDILKECRISNYYWPMYSVFDDINAFIEDLESLDSDTGDLNVGVTIYLENICIIPHNILQSIIDSMVEYPLIENDNQNVGE